MSFAFLPLYTGDYLRDTRHLTPLKHGVYLLLLMHCWDQQGPLPLDEQECAGIANCRSADEVEALRYILERFFIHTEDGWYNKRMTEEVAKADKISAQNREAGLKSAEIRRKIRKQRAFNERLTRVGTPTPTPTLTLTPTLTPITSKTNTRAKALAQAPFVLPDWIPKEPWDAWIESRTKARKSPTNYAKRLAVMKLENLKDQGHPPVQVLMNAAFNGWTGLWPPKEIK